MNTKSITTTAIAALLLSAGAVFAADGRRVEQGNRVASTTRQAPSAQGAEVVELKEHPTQKEAAVAGFLREQRVLRRLREMRAALHLQNFYCDSGPAIQAALTTFWGIEAECPDEEVQASSTPTCRYASRVADPC